MKQPSDARDFGAVHRFVSHDIRRVVIPRIGINKRGVEDRLQEAIRTLAALPDKERKWIYGQLTSWPETLREAIDMMAIALERVATGKSAYEDMRPSRPVPSAEAIDRMDKTLPWLVLLDERERKLVMARAFDVYWTKLAAKYGKSEYHVKKWYAQTIDKVWLAVSICND